MQSTARTEALETVSQDLDSAAFNFALTALSMRYGIGIAGTPTLFVMEKEDYERSYHANEASELVFE